MTVTQLWYWFKVAARLTVVMTLCALTFATRAWAHASDQGLVLLLPTDLYISSGVAAVVLTVVLLAVVPDRLAGALFRPLPLMHRIRTGLPLVTSCLSAGVFLWLVTVGLKGPRDPLSNPMTLGIWTLWWVGLVSVQGLIGDFWRWINPWTGPVALLRRVLSLAPFLRLPGRAGYALAMLSFLGFAMFLMVDVAPADPERLARVAGAYWLLTLLAALAFGPRWFLRAEGISVLMRCYAQMALFGRRGDRMAIGLWGWQSLSVRVPPLGLAVFMVMMLGSGSFDGLNETFWWLAQLGVNPLEFPGRSAVVWPNFVGLLAANVALVAVFAGTIWLGLRLIRSDMPLARAFALFAPSILPIALGYHIAHYYTSFLVEAQYAVAAFNDPWAKGADLLGLGTFYVTTGFFNTPDSVRLIFLTQAGAVVLGHVIAVLMAHVLALRAFGNVRDAALSQFPLAIFMIFYTFFGLWLLASPRGV